MIKKLLFLLILIFGISKTLVVSVEARSGCCSHHGGVCGCGCCDGTSLSTTCAPYYPWCYEDTSIPIQTVQQCNPPADFTSGGSWSFNENGCNQNVVLTWNKGSEPLSYSLALSKTIGADPGPNVDTSTESFVFKDVTPGKWYVNIKSGNSCAWGNIKYWTIDVPSVKPRIDKFDYKIIDKGKVELSYSTTCANKASISSIGTISLNRNSIIVSPITDTTYKLSVSGQGGTTERDVSITLPTPIPSPEAPTASPSPKVETKKGSINSLRDFWKRIFKK